MPVVKKSRSGKRVASRKTVSLVKESRHQSDPRVTVSTLPDDVLLEIFDFYLVENDLDAWYILVHVCKNWRCIVFASAQRLRLQLVCTNKSPVQNLLDVWPELPIVIQGRRGTSKPQYANNLISALKEHNRVCKIDIGDIPNAFLKKMRAMKMTDPFPALTFLSLWSRKDNAPALPDSFLGGSAPQLQEIYLNHIPFPGLPKLLLSTRDLVELDLWRIPLSGYISSDAMVTCLSALTLLKKLTLRFLSPLSPVHRENRLLPRLTRVVIPALTKFSFKGDSEYLEDIVAQIDTPRLDRLGITFFNKLIFDTPLLRHFICRTETLMLPHQAKMTFDDYIVNVNLSRRDGHDILSSSISCRSSDWQLSSLAQICDSALFPLPTIDRLEIRSSRNYWEDDMDNTQWLEVLNPFTSLKDLVLVGSLIRLVALALEDLTGDRVTEVLPALQNLFLSGSLPLESVEKAIGKFTAARQLSGRPVTVYDRKTRDQDYIRWEVGN